ncbi:MAG TPA: peptidylprolyl isomerase, partial [Aquaticitalea sp.]|nr:peptidylprolyl isomerase [Aquaticitalea sp.]
YLKKGLSDDEIGKKLNSENEQKVIFTKGIMEVDNQSLPKHLDLKKGLSNVYENNDAYHVLLVKNFYKSEPKTFDEAKGKLTGDYQNKLEEDWIKTLRQRYKVEVNNNALKTVKKQLTY